MKRFEDIIKEKVENFEYPYEQGAWENYNRRRRTQKIKKWGLASTVIIGIITTVVLILTKPEKAVMPFHSKQNNVIITTNNSIPLNTQVNEIKTNKDKQTQTTINHQENNQSTIKQESPQTVTNNITDLSTTMSENNAQNTSTLNTASFTKNSSQGCAPLEVQFTAITTGKNCQYLWNFGDGTTANEKNPIHLYKKGGKYNVYLTVQWNEKDKYTTDVQTIQVYNKPTALFDYSLENNTVRFESRTKQAISHKWLIEDTIVNGSYWKFDITHSGKYMVQYIVENADGCSDTSIKDINVSYKMPVQFANAFSPDNDGINDFFGPQVIDYSYYQFTMNIFNKTGKCVFYTKGSPALWDGNDKETKQSCPAGIYIYKIIAVDKKGNKNEFSGQIKLLR